MLNALLSLVKIHVKHRESNNFGKHFNRAAVASQSKDAFQRLFSFLDDRLHIGRLGRGIRRLWSPRIKKPNQRSREDSNLEDGRGVSRKFITVCAESLFEVSFLCFQ